MGVAAGASLLPVGRLLSAQGEASQGAADLRAVKLSGAETTIERAAVRDLRASLSGTLLLPDGDEYEAARHVWNGMIDKHPAPEQARMGLARDGSLHVSHVIGSSAPSSAIPITARGRCPFLSL